MKQIYVLAAVRACVPLLICMCGRKVRTITLKKHYVGARWSMSPALREPTRSRAEIAQAVKRLAPTYRIAFGLGNRFSPRRRKNDHNADRSGPRQPAAR